MSCVDQARYTEDLVTISGARPPGSPHWQEVQDLCAGRLEQLGYQVELQEYSTGVNVLGVLPGSNHPDERIMVSAHYDSTPGCPGANDNASGVAALLELARVLALADHARTLVLACWDEEELGMYGSRAYAQLARQRGEILTGVLVFDTIGYRSNEPGIQSYPTGLDLLYPDLYDEMVENEFRGDFIALVSDSLSVTLAWSIVGYGAQIGLKVIDIAVPDALKESDQLGDLKLSDHTPFWGVDYPGVYLSDTGKFRFPYIHCQGGPDVPEVLDHTFAAQAIQASVGAIAEALDEE